MDLSQNETIDRGDLFLSGDLTILTLISYDQIWHILVMLAIAKSGESAVNGKEDDEGRRQQQTVQSVLTGALVRAVFVIGGLVLVFESASNSLTWHMGRFWGSAGDNWQHLWNHVLSIVSMGYGKLKEHK